MGPFLYLIDNSQDCLLQLYCRGQNRINLMLNIFLDSTRDECCCPYSLAPCLGLTALLRGMFLIWDKQNQRNANYANSLLVVFGFYCVVAGPSLCHRVQPLERSGPVTGTEVRPEVVTRAGLELGKRRSIPSHIPFISLFLTIQIISWFITFYATLLSRLHYFAVVRTRHSYPSFVSFRGNFDMVFWETASVITPFLMLFSIIYLQYEVCPQHWRF